MTTNPLERFVKTDPATRKSDELIHSIKVKFNDKRGDIVHAGMIGFRTVSLTNPFAYMALEMKAVDQYTTAFNFISMYREIYKVSSGLETARGNFCSLFLINREITPTPPPNGTRKAVDAITGYMKEIDTIYPNRHVLRLIPNCLAKALEDKGYKLSRYGTAVCQKTSPMTGIRSLFTPDYETQSKLLQLQFYSEDPDLPSALIDFNYHPLMEEVIHSSIMKAGKTNEGT